MAIQGHTFCGQWKGKANNSI